MTKKSIAVCVFAAAVLGITLLGADPQGERTLQRGIDLLESKGDLAKAMPLFEQASHSSDRALAARALLYLGQAQERQAADKARATYERIVKDFGSQKDSAEEAQKRLVAIGGAVSENLRARELMTIGKLSYDTISPDGQWLGGTDWANGDLVLQHVSSGEVRRLVRAAFDKTPETWGEGPVLSPDQKQVAYLWFDDGDPKGSSQLRVMPNEPSAKFRVLFSKPDEYGNMYPEAWSADGKRVLASLDRRHGKSGFEIAWITVSDGTVQIIKSLEAWRITRDLRSGNEISPLSLSPDGALIAYSAKCRQDAADTCVYLLSADGSSEAALIQGGTNESPVWTPDGKNVVFSSNRSGAFGLWSVPVLNGKRAGVPSLVKPDMGRIRAIGLTKAGTYFYDYKAGLNQILVSDVDPETGKSRGTGITESFIGVAPAWSRDGKWLAFKRQRQGSNNYDLIVHSMEKGSEWTFSPPQMGNAGPIWYLDGTVQPIRKNTLRVSVAGGQPKETTAPRESVLGLLSPDDKLLYGVFNPGPENNKSPAGGVEVIDVATGQRKQMIIIPGGAIGAALSPDGKTLSVVSRPNLKRRIATVSTDGSNYREIASSGPSSGKMAWTRDGRYILFARQDENSPVWRFMRIPATGGEPEFIGISANLVGDFKLSPDGSKIAYTSRTTNEDLWALDNVPAAIKK